MKCSFMHAGVSLVCHTITELFRQLLTTPQYQLSDEILGEISFRSRNKNGNAFVKMITVTISNSFTCGLESSTL